MGYNKGNYKRIRAEYETKAFRAQEAAEARREELYRTIPELRALDTSLSHYGMRILHTALHSGSTAEDIAVLRAENQALNDRRAALLSAHGFQPDYSEPRYECNDCGDTGYVGIKMCSCMRRRLIEAGMESSGLLGLMRAQSFENFSLDYYRDDAEVFARMENNYNTAVQYATQFSFSGTDSSPQSLLFLGGTGLGKTHLSTSVARVVIERGYDVFYNSAVGMISDFECRRFGNGLAQTEGEDTARYTDCDLLIIDDLGTEVVNQFTLSCLYHVLNTRLNLQKPTLISTNLTSADLRKTYSDRITSRLMGEFLILPFYGTDVRKQKLKNKR